MDRDRDARGRRFDDGEVVRYGAGESWRPTPRGGGGGGDRSPRRPRSPPPRDRPRSRSPRPRSRSPRPRSPRPRSPMMGASDSYVPGRYPPRRRSRSGDRFRRDRSRGGGRDSPRRRERSRSPVRRSPMRRSPSRRPSPPPLRDDRFDRPPRSPRRDWDRDRDRNWQDRDRGRERDRDWDRDRDQDRGRMPERERERDFDRRDERKRSRSPFGRDPRDRSLSRRRSPPPRAGSRGASYRPRSRSPGRWGDRYQSYRRPSPPPRDSGISSAINSQAVSRRSSPRPGSIKARSPLPPREESPFAPAMSGSASVRDDRRTLVTEMSSNLRSPPRGPAALRAPSGPVQSRSLNSSVPGSPAPSSQRLPQTPGGTAPHSETASPPHPPTGPRGYVPPSRGSYSSRGSRGGWSQPPSRQMSGLSPGASTPNASSNIPTGPRGSTAGLPSSSSASGRAFNPPTGPAAQHGSGPRQTLAQSLLATMPPIIPGGKLDASMTPLTIGVVRELEPHYRKLREEEEKMRADLCAKQERLRKSLHTWSKLDRDSKAWELRSDLSERSMKNLAGEGIGGAAF